MGDHLGYEKPKRSDKEDYRNGYKQKRVNSSNGTMEIDIPQIEDWQNRPLDDVYPIVYINAIHYSVSDIGIIKKLANYVIQGINKERRKDRCSNF